MRTLLAAIFLLSQFISVAQDKSAIICGQYENSQVSAISIDVSSVLDQQSTSYIAFTDPKNRTFRFDFPISEMQEVIMRSDRNFSLLISPGDSLFMTMKKNGDVLFSGSNSKVNQEIFKYNTTKKNEKFIPQPDGKTLQQYLTVLHAQTKKDLEALNGFEKTNPGSKLFHSWANNTIIYSNANYLIDYVLHKHMNKQSLEKDVMSTRIFPVDNDAALISLFYRAHVNQYLVFNYRFHELIRGLKKDYGNFASLQPRFDSLIAAEKPTRSRDVMVIDLFNLLLKTEPNHAQDFIKLNVHKIRTDELRAQYMKRLEMFRTTNSRVTFLGEQHSDSKIIANIFKDMSERFAGKIIYIDFWATWCGPCRREFPYSISLEKSFDEKDVAFVYVCLDSEIEKWKTAVKNLKLNANQYFLNEVESKVFRQKFQIHGIPTYYLINRAGELVNKDASRPSSEEIREEIKRLVEAK